MKRFLSLLILLLTCLPACGVKPIDVAAKTADAVQVAATDAYFMQQADAIDRAETREQAEAAVEKIRRDWVPFWKAWDVAREALMTWARLDQAVESGDASDAAAMAADEARKRAMAALCRAIELAPADLPDPGCMK